jgi:hypothetical protein
MRLVSCGLSAALIASALGGCATFDNSGDDWVSACQRDYQRNRAAAIAAGALVGAAAGAAVAKNDAAGAAIGAVAGGLIGSQIGKKDDPCGYGFGGYPYDRRYGVWDERRGLWVR